MKWRLVIITEIIAPYRIPVFNALAQNAAIDLQVIFLSETDRELRQWHIYRDEIRFSYRVLPSWRLQMGKRKLLFNCGLKAALERFTPQTVICGGYNYVASWSAALWARARGIPFILWTESTERDARSGGFLTERLRNKFLGYCSGFVVPGSASLQYLTQLKVSEEIVYTAPNAVDNDFFAITSQATRETIGYRAAHGLPDRFILYAGRFVPSKGIFDLLAAYEGLPAEITSAVGLVFVGGGPAESHLRTLSGKSPRGRISVLSFRQREDLAALYASADVFVFPTHSDPWGLVVNEAMACGLPIVCTDIAGCVADLVSDGWNGKVVPSGAPLALADAIELLLRSDDMRSLMGTNSRERIGMFSPQHCADGLASAALAMKAENLPAGSHHD